MSRPVDGLEIGCALRMKPALQLPNKLERAWRRTFGERTWYLAGWDESACCLARTKGGYGFEFVGVHPLNLFHVVPQIAAAAKPSGEKS